jgi:competence protein ComEC
MRPLVPLVISFILGIVISGRVGFTYGALAALLPLSVVPVLVAMKRGWQLRPLLILPPFFFLGALFILPIERPYIPTDHIVNSIGSGQGPLGSRVEGVVTSEPEVRGEHVRLYVDALRAGWGGDPGPADGDSEADPGSPTSPDTPDIENDRLENRPAKAVTGRILLTVEGFETGLKRGDRVIFMARLKEPRNFGNPGGFDYEWWLKNKGVFVTGYVKEGFLVKIKEGDRGPLSRIGAWRGGIRTFIDSSDLENSGILKALLIGERAGIPEDIKEVFIRAGAAHILAISGLHVGLVAYFAYAVILWLLKRSEGLMLALNVKKVAAVSAMAPVLLYAAIAGFSVSTQRAVIMVGAFIFTMLIDREKDLYNTLALAALVILLVSPGSVWDASFQLSFLAVLGIIYLVPGLTAFFEQGDKTEPPEKRHWLSETMEKIKLPFFVTAAAILATAPVLAFHFHRVSPAGFITNLFVIPLVGFAAVPLGLLSAFILPFWEGLSFIILNLSDAVLGGTVFLLRFFSKLPYSYLWVTTPTVFEIILFYFLIVCVFEVKKRRLALYLLPVVLLAIILDVGFYNYRGLWDRGGLGDRGDLKVTFISVGQGDSSLLEFPPDTRGRRKTMLIDGGGLYVSGFDTGEMVVSPVLWKKKIKRLDYIVLSHPQRDHMGGLEFIAENFGPGEFWWNGYGGVLRGLGGLEEVLKKTGTKLITVDGSTEKRVINGVGVEFLHPLKESQLTGPNNNSLVMKITYGKRSFLFTGDIGGEAEELLVGRDIRADVVKVPHHGSRSSSTARFLDAVDPEVAVISAGWENIFGFPHKEVIGRYSSRGINLLRTDVHGAVTITTDGQGVSVRTHLTGEGT